LETSISVTTNTYGEALINLKVFHYPHQSQRKHIWSTQNSSHNPSFKFRRNKNNVSLLKKDHLIS